MPEAVAMTYNSLSLLAQKEVNDFINYLAMKMETNKAEESPFLKYCGVLDDGDAKIMMDAINDCRRIEPNEW